MNECIICGREYTRLGNNPNPVATTGRCCDECDSLNVIPARIRALGQQADIALAVGKRNLAMINWVKANPGKSFEDYLKSEI